jgi:hypothetical protein
MLSLESVGSLLSHGGGGKQKNSTEVGKQTPTARIQLKRVGRGILDS